MSKTKSKSKPEAEVAAPPETLADLIIKQLDRVHVRTARY